MREVLGVAGTEYERSATFALGPLTTASIPVGERGRVALDLGAGMEWIPDASRHVGVHYYVQSRVIAAWSR